MARRTTLETTVAAEGAAPPRYPQCACGTRLVLEREQASGVCEDCQRPVAPVNQAEGVCDECRAAYDAAFGEAALEGLEEAADQARPAGAE